MAPILHPRRDHHGSGKGRRAGKHLASLGKKYPVESRPAIRRTHHALGYNCLIRRQKINSPNPGGTIGWATTIHPGIRERCQHGPHLSIFLIVRGFSQLSPPRRGWHCPCSPHPVLRCGPFHIDTNRADRHKESVMQKFLVAGMLLIVLVTLGGCYWPGHHGHGRYGHGIHDRYDQRYEYRHDHRSDRHYDRHKHDRSREYPSPRRQRW